MKSTTPVKVLTQLSLMELRSILADQINLVRKGEVQAGSVNAISNATGKYLATIKLELEYYKMLGQTPNLTGLVGGTASDAEKPNGSAKPGRLP